MTQDAFIQQLRHELRSLPKQVVDEIVADYREYFGDALAAGRSEAEVVAALGDPVKLARELKAQASFRQWETRRSFGNLMRVVVSIAGLGLLQLFLLIPFMFYLLMLTVGYMVSGALVVAGLVTVVALGSHHLFGWPAFHSLPFTFESSDVKTGQQASTNGNDDDDDDAADDVPKQGDPRLATANMKVFRVDGDRFVLRPDAATRISVVTLAGPIDIKNDDGKLKINSVGGARDLFKVDPDGTWSIAATDIVALDLKDGEGDKVSVARIGTGAKALAWDIRNHGDHVSFVQGADGSGKRLAVNSGTDSVVIDRDHISIKDGSDNVVIVGPHGSGIGAMIYGFTMLVAGIVGLWLCLWLTRITWRALVRYVQRQLDLITARLDEGQSA
ncbi:hypothetical protein LMG24238_02363 [Paraburkholderia sediminicola]|uniref:DUF1700 domain-containing protein n=1 Tax=Paraburkholderia sediminicola TaxID=458836 RepID=A0A6J5ANP5_9BURK|nr:DUF1700 domain-containing protein [Paraburkholderia sediminicola]CAB3676047.1 hypothetical protein LMG24238_02363 [Paraburkholderia sediminicola]